MQYLLRRQSAPRPLRRSRASSRDWGSGGGPCARIRRSSSPCNIVARTGGAGAIAGKSSLWAAVRITVRDACAAHASQVGAVVKLTLVGRLHGTHVAGTAVAPGGVTPVFAPKKFCAAVKITFWDACAVQPSCGCCGGARWHSSGARARSPVSRSRLPSGTLAWHTQVAGAAAAPRWRGSGARTAMVRCRPLGEEGVVLAVVSPPPSKSAFVSQRVASS